MASAVPSTQRLAARYSDRIRNGTQTARKIASPPIVGVPALPWWPAGPSSRMCWPNSFSAQELDEARPQEHADEQGGHAPDEDLAEHA